MPIARSSAAAACAPLRRDRSYRLRCSACARTFLVPQRANQPDYDHARADHGKRIDNEPRLARNDDLVAGLHIVFSTLAGLPSRRTTALRAADDGDLPSVRGLANTTSFGNRVTYT